MPGAIANTLRDSDHVTITPMKAECEYIAQYSSPYMKGRVGPDKLGWARLRAETIVHTATLTRFARSHRRRPRHGPDSRLPPPPPPPVSPS